MINNKNIIYIKNDNNINIKINQYIIININKNKIDFLYIINKDIILYK